MLDREGKQTWNLTWPRSVLHLMSVVTLGILIGGFGLFVILFLVADIGLWLLFLSIPYNVYAYCIWGYLIYTILYEFRYKNLHHPWVPFVELVLIYAVTVVQNLQLYAIISKAQSNSFIGITSGLPNWRILYNSFFLASETTAALGSIFENPLLTDAEVGFVVVWINSMQTIALFTFIGWGLSRRVDRFTQRVKLTKKKKGRKTRSSRHETDDWK